MRYQQQQPSVESIILVSQYEGQFLEKLKVIEEFRLAKRQLEKNIEVLQTAQKSDNPKIKKLAAGQAQTQNMKNLERMKVEVNKRIEQNMTEIVKLLDSMG